MTNPDLNKFAGQKIVVGLSGGVDSAVAALLLQRAGAEVQALHMTNWEDDAGYCTAADDLQDARRLCEQIGIPLHHVNFAAEYRNRVFEHFLDEYRAGRTPNPDVLCNREIKFGVFREHAMRLGADLLATGHYARVEHGADGAHLLKGVDPGKDQSYFLHAVKQKALADTVFPLGDLQKNAVRTLAREAGLAVYDKKDSTGICFIGERPFRQFLATYLPAQPGNIQTADGRTLGEHQGLMYYTLGQRQGLGIGGRNDAGDEAWYVAAKDLAQNALIVVQGEHPLLFSTGMTTGVPHWIGTAPDFSDAAFHCKVKVRYRQTDQPCRVSSAAGGGLRVAFETPQRAVAPGQYAVFYSDDRCLGGAVIEATHAAEAELRNAI